MVGARRAAGLRQVNSEAGAIRIGIAKAPGIGGAPPRHNAAMRAAAAFFVSLMFAAHSAPAQECAAATWQRLEGDRAATVASDALLDELARRDVVLLGESHDEADHHRWQLHTLAALHSRRPDMVLGFEMFPRRVQPVLDRWVAGELTPAQLLAQVKWDEIWNVPAELYLPLFEFARLHRVPMVALNVDRQLIQAVAARGWDALPAAQREGVSRPAAAPQAYVEELERVYRDHGERTPFKNFVEAQQTWDRAMAEALARQPRSRLAVGVMGTGHLRHGYGVPLQLRDLGVLRVAALLPVAREECRSLAAGVADAVFVLPVAAEAKPPPPRLGVQLAQEGDAVRLAEVLAGSLAERSGLKKGDIVAAAAGKPLKRAADLAALVRAQPAGTWLPLEVGRAGARHEVVIRFPPAP
jgi:uncharacterized iron-regulated protein